MKKYTIVRKRIPEKIYREIHRSMPFIWVDVVAVSGKDFLLGKRTKQPQKGKWWFPGGRLLKNELLKDAVVRILKKEMGLKGKAEKFLGFYELFENPGYFKGINGHGIVFVFKVKTSKKSKISLDSQHSAASWFSKINPSWYPYVKKFLGEAGFR